VIPVAANTENRLRQLAGKAECQFSSRSHRASVPPHL
jgi:hypothetical protein